MTKDNQDTLVRAYSKLKSLREHISQMSSPIPETYVREYHSVLDKLESIRIDVSEFRIPDSEVKPRTVASQYVEGRKIWSSDVIGAEKSFILTQLDAILGYFEIITSEKPKKMGFHTPDDE